jgi:hypothetical protein
MYEDMLKIYQMQDKSERLQTKFNIYDFILYKVISWLNTSLTTS